MYLWLLISTACCTWQSSHDVDFGVNLFIFPWLYLLPLTFGAALGLIIPLDVPETFQCIGIPATHPGLPCRAPRTVTRTPKSVESYAETTLRVLCSTHVWAAPPHKKHRARVFGAPGCLPGSAPFGTRGTAELRTKWLRGTGGTPTCHGLVCQWPPW